jgi:hypothetical protein
VRPLQPALQGAACNDLLVVLSVVAGLEGGRPWGVGKLEGLGFTTPGALQEACARVPLSLLDLRGGGPCRALGGNVLLKGRSGLTRHGNLFRHGSDRTG